MNTDQRTTRPLTTRRPETRPKSRRPVVRGPVVLFSWILTTTLLLAMHEVSPAGETAPPLREFPGIQADAAGGKLQSSMIWAGPEAKGDGVAVVFRKIFQLARQPGKAEIFIFADARYILWVNGQYLERGPARFQPNGPEYDTVEIAPHLQAGANVVAVLVVGNLSGGKVMRHQPGLAAMLEGDGREILRTDASWHCTLENRYRTVAASWADIVDEQVDARVEDGDWTATNYDDSRWNPSAPIDGQVWGPLTARRIPRLRETPVSFQIQDGATLPVTLEPGQRLTFAPSHIVQAYPVISFTADAGTELAINPYKLNYTAKAGAQTCFTLDTMGTTKVEIVVKQGRATITGFKLMERLYPYTRMGAFTCNDPLLNRALEHVRPLVRGVERGFLCGLRRPRARGMDGRHAARIRPHPNPDGRPERHGGQAGIQRSTIVGGIGAAHRTDPPAGRLGQSAHLLGSV